MALEVRSSAHRRSESKQSCMHASNNEKSTHAFTLPSAQAHFVPELTVRGIASESKFVHQFFMTYLMCVDFFGIFSSSDFFTASPIHLLLPVRVTWSVFFRVSSAFSVNCSLFVKAT